MNSRLLPIAYLFLALIVMGWEPVNIAAQINLPCTPPLSGLTV